VKPFSYVPAASLDEALELLMRHGDDARLMAGGTALVILLRHDLAQPGIVIGLDRIAELAGVRAEEDGGLAVGALTSLHRLELEPLVRMRAPALARTIHTVASVRVRNQATLGGNLVHADPAQDPPPMLMALDASLVLECSSGCRTVPLDEFYVGMFETVIRRDEVLTSIRIPPQPEGARFTYVKFLPRTVDDFATVSVAVRIDPAPDGTILDARIALGSAGTVPMRAEAAESAIRGHKPDPALIDDVAALARDAADPIPDVRGSVAYKREMVRVWTARALRDVTGLGAQRD
jgi:carbon-monoxide dehydrogenase medium subunit